jgi:hypothetical protein
MIWGRNAPCRAGVLSVAFTGAPVLSLLTRIEPGLLGAPFASQAMVPADADAASFQSFATLVSDVKSVQNPGVFPLQNAELPEDPELVELALDDDVLGASIALSATVLSPTLLSGAPLELAVPEEPDCPERLAELPLDAALPELAIASRSPCAAGSSSLRPKIAAQPALTIPMHSTTTRMGVFGVTG